MRLTFYNRAADGKTPVPVMARQWDRNDIDPHVGNAWINIQGDMMGEPVTSHDAWAIHISTTWMGIDHAVADGPPVLWETMIFLSAALVPDAEASAIVYDELNRAYQELYQERYTSHVAALARHADLTAVMIHYLQEIQQNGDPFSIADALSRIERITHP